MIVSLMKSKKILIRQLRNHIRIAARLHRIGCMRIKRIHNLPVKHIVRGRKSPFHLIVNYPVNGQLVFCILQLIVPAFLPENLLLPINIRMKYRVQIYVHKVAKIFIIAACHGINRLIRIGHGIQKRI